MSNKPYITILTTCFMLLLCASAHAQMMVPAPLAQRVKNAQKIAVGRIVDKHSYWDVDRHNIWTINLMEVRAYFKNDSRDYAERIAVITSGGIVGNEGQITCPSFDFAVNQEYAVFLDADNHKVDDKAYRQNLPNVPQCEPYASSQGVLGYVDGKYRDLMVESPMNEVELVKRLNADFGLSPTPPTRDKIFTPREAPQYVALLGSITGWANGGGTLNSTGSYIGATIVANNELIITGTGFGTVAGTVEFDHVDDGLSIGTQGYASTIASDIVSWSDVQIRTKIPSKAGTGIFRVKDNTSTVVGTSATNITIIWSQINIATTTLNFATSTRQQTKFANLNAAGGYTFLYSTVVAGGTAFSTNTPAKAAFERALINWRCATRVNLKTSTTTTSVGPASDGICSVSFNPSLAANVLGSCISRFSLQGLSGTCDMHNTLVFISELDVQMSPDAATFGWNYGTGATSGNQIDFESVMLHEIGHGHGCDHINNSVLSMNWAISTNTDKRTLTANEITCGDFRVSNSTSAFCVSSLSGGSQPMVRVSLVGCTNVLPLELLDFNARPNGQKSALVTWQTANEQAVAYFDLERSDNGKDFRPLSKIEAANSLNQFYKFVDDNPLANIHYYRLKMVDNDGNFTYSHVKTVIFDNSKRTTFTAYPNPAHNNLTVDYYGADEQKKSVEYTITNLLGQTLLRGLLTNNIDILSLPTGAFILKIGDGQSKFFKL